MYTNAHAAIEAG